MAALLALKRHYKIAANQGEFETDNLEGHINRAKVGLQMSLGAWDVESTMHVGFEFLIPAMLEMLSSEGLSFKFPGSSTLAALNGAKLSKFKPELLFQRSTPFMHSLEAFIGKIDFDRVKPHRISGSMLASPASTAAHLMCASNWDYEAAEYLRRVLQRPGGDGSGGVPSFFPSPIFETTWVSHDYINCNEVILSILARLFLHFSIAASVLCLLVSKTPDALPPSLRNNCRIKQGWLGSVRS